MGVDRVCKKGKNKKDDSYIKENATVINNAAVKEFATVIENA